MELESTQKEPPHIAMLPSPGMGHLIPLIELAKRLVQHHQFLLTFFIPTEGPPSKAQISTVESLPTSIHSVFLPPVSVNDVAEDARIETRISLTVQRSLPSLRRELNSLVEKNITVSALVVDLFATDAFDVAIDLNISPYIFHPSTAMLLSLFLLHLENLDSTVPFPCEYRDMSEPFRIPGSIPIHGKDLLDPLQERKNEAYKWVLHHAKRYKLAEGIMVNSFIDMEPGPLKALQQQDPGFNKPPVYPVGPLVKVDSNANKKNEEEEEEYMKWLDDQTLGSVLFVCFGSGGTLSQEQLNELALGLEMSEQRFLWVVRSPNDAVANASFFTGESQKNPLDFLPKGFLDRTKGRGVLVPSWAPQALVLSHGSIGGFVCHCGWNSVLESVVNGVPLIAWPLYAEQRMNAVMLTEDIKAALRPKANENGIVGRDEIGKVVKALMEGEQGKEVRNKMKHLKDAAALVLTETGSSAKALAELASKWKKNKQPCPCISN